MWLFCFVAITTIVTPLVKPQLLYEGDNMLLINNPDEMKKTFLSLMNAFDRKIGENFTRLLAGVQNDFQSKLGNLSAKLMSVQNENKEIKSKLLYLSKRQTDAQSHIYPTRPTVEAERNIIDIQTNLDAKIKEKFEKLESSIQANLTLRLEGNNVVMEDNKEMKRIIGYLNNTQTELKFKVDVLEKLLKEKEKWNARVAINESSLNNLERKTQVLNDTLHDLQNECFVTKANISTIVLDVEKEADILEQMASKITKQRIQLNETSQSMYELKEQANNNTNYIARVKSAADIMRNELFFS